MSLLSDKETYRKKIEPKLKKIRSRTMILENRNATAEADIEIRHDQKAVDFMARQILV